MPAAKLDRYGNPFPDPPESAPNRAARLAREAAEAAHAADAPARDAAREAYEAAEDSRAATADTRREAARQSLAAEVLAAAPGLAAEARDRAAAPGWTYERPTAEAQARGIGLPVDLAPVVAVWIDQDPTPARYARVQDLGPR